MKTNYKVYLIKDLQNNPVYCGLTKQSLKTRFDQHYRRRKFDRTKYYIEAVSSKLTIEQAVVLEEMLIEQYKLRINGWNVSPRSINGYSNAHSEEQKVKWSKERKGKSVSLEHAAKNRVARLGQKSSPEHVEKIMAKKRKPVMCLNNGKIYKSAREAARELGISYCRISEVCNGKRTHTKRYKFKFVKKKQ